MHNFVKFVVIQEKCKVVHPQFGFYILIILTLISDIIYSIMLVRTYIDWMPFVLFMPPTFKFLSGIEQIWMMIELSLHLRVELKMHGNRNIHTEREMADQMSTLFKWCRIALLIIMVSALIAMTTVSTIIFKTTIEKEEQDLVDRASVIFAFLFVVEFVGISTLVGVLTHYLVKKKNLMHKGKSS